MRSLEPRRWRSNWMGMLILTCTSTMEDVEKVQWTLSKNTGIDKEYDSLCQSDSRQCHIHFWNEWCTTRRTVFLQELSRSKGETPLQQRVCSHVCRYSQPSGWEVWTWPDLKTFWTAIAALCILRNLILILRFTKVLVLQNSWWDDFSLSSSASCTTTSWRI